MSFKDFTRLFPPAEFPLHFGEDTYRTYESAGKLIPDEALAEFVAPMEAELDEFTEVLACAQFSRKGYTALVYWKAGLLHNHYRLATFDARGEPVENRVIAGSYVDGEGVSQSAATITEEHVVYVVSAREDTFEELGAADKSSALRLGIDDGGVIRELGAPEEG